MATAAGTLPAKAKTTAPREESQLAIVVKRFMRHRLAVFSVFLILVIFVASLLAPWITTYPRDAIDVSGSARPAPPGVVTGDGNVHLLGIDHVGRDLFTRVLYAGRISLSIAISVVLLSETMGVLVGALAGYYGGWIDTIVSRLIEFMLSIPLLPILLVVSAILLRTDTELPMPGFLVSILSAILLASEREAQKVVVLVLILVAFGWLGAARLMRGMALSLRNQDFVESLRALGASDARIIVRHIIPNGLAPILVNASLSLGAVIITEAALSFLGLGIQDPTPSWGNMLAQSQSYMFQHPWLPLVPGIPLVLVSLSFNFIGDGLRDALDPRLKR
ncbi:MAG TPA: ABC transporter permease [Caldilineaceae bacterium]|nr:ABC transporter permease [Caldilineaceae bacterium]